MASKHQPALLLVVLALLVLSVAEAAVLVAVVPRGSDERFETAVVGGKATGGMAMQQSEGERSGARAATGSGRRDDEETIQIAVTARLDALRDEKRELFVGTLAARVEDAIGRSLNSEEREAVSRSSREYFSAVDERGRAESPDAQGERIGPAWQERLAVLGRIAGSETDAARMLDEAMRALEAESGASTGGTSPGADVPR